MLFSRLRSRPATTPSSQLNPATALLTADEDDFDHLQKGTRLIVREDSIALPEDADIFESLPVPALAAGTFAPDTNHISSPETWYDEITATPSPVPLFSEVSRMNSPIVFVSGSKGGVGKSITTMAVLDYLQTKSAMCKLVESDTSNPDVFRSYNRAAECEEVDLDDVEGWIDLVNICESPSFKTVVVNTPARNNAGARQHGEVLLSALAELSRPLITLWVINRQRDSIDLLAEYLDIMPGGTVHVVMNGYFGEEKKFELYRNSSVRERVASQGGVELYLPDLADRVTDELYSKRITLAQAAQQLKIGDRTELQRWRNAVAQLFTSISL